MKNNIDVNKIDEFGRTQIFDAIINGNLDEVKKLCILGIDVNHQDKKGKSPLHFSSIYNQIDIARVLISYGANVNLRDNNGNMPIFDAIFNSKGKPELVLLLIENNADFKTKNIHDISPEDLVNNISNFDLSFVFK